jgi:glucose/arabinose dehydrogenase
MPLPAIGGVLSGPVVDDGVETELEEIVQLPFTSTQQPRTRINLLREAPDGSGRLFVNDLRGPLYVIDAGVVLTYLDMQSLRPAMNAGPGIGSGFGSFAFHPEFASNGLFYTVHTETPGIVTPNFVAAVSTTVEQHTIVTEWAATDPAANAFAGSARELIRIAALGHDHSLGEVTFNPGAQPGEDDYGLLYIGAGDLSSVHELEPFQVQRLDTLYGCILRIDPLGTPFLRDGLTFDYGIPASNPFANDGDPDTLGEIYAYGTRNAHRIAWDPNGSGLALVSDIGEGNLEEINVLAPGANYGWPEREGTYALEVDVDTQQVLSLPLDDASFGFAYPAAQYDHEEGLAIAGGAVYRGTVVSPLFGSFLFGDIVTGRLFFADVSELVAADDDDPATTATVHELNLVRDGNSTALLALVRDAMSNPFIARTDLRFGTDASGDVYVTTKGDGWVRRVVLESATPVPEPAVWAAWIAAAEVGVLAALRRHRRSRSCPGWRQTD